jgi:hypothetical protein
MHNFTLNIQRALRNQKTFYICFFHLLSPSDEIYPLIPNPVSLCQPLSVIRSLVKIIFRCPNQAIRYIFKAPTHGIRANREDCRVIEAKLVLGLFRSGRDAISCVSYLVMLCGFCFGFRLMHRAIRVVGGCVDRV